MHERNGSITPSGPNLGAVGFRCYAQWNSPWGVRASAVQVLTVWSAVSSLCCRTGCGQVVFGPKGTSIGILWSAEGTVPLLGWSVGVTCI